MLDRIVLDKLLECHLEEDIVRLLKDEVFPKSKNSKFTDNVLQFKGNSGEYVNVHLGLDGINNIICRLILLLKLHGHMGIIPKNSGVRAYATAISSIVRKLSSKKSIVDITFNEFIKFVVQREKEVQAKSVKEEIRKIYDWIIIANPLLPHICRLDERLLIGDENIDRINEKASRDHIDYTNGFGGHESKVFPLKDTIIIMKKALNYVDHYADEIILCIPPYLQRKDMINVYQERKYLVTCIKDIKHTFQEPNLKTLQDDSNNFAAHKVSNPAQRVLKSIKLLEAACIFIALSLTGYRANEFLKLQRFPEFRQEEYDYLVRHITKTSFDEGGEEIEMPIPSAAKQAIEILSKLASFQDNMNKGNLLNVSWENLDVDKVTSPSQRLLLSIQYFCKDNNLPSPTPHMTRHTMAFLITYLSEGDSLELARLFLCHKSITMTLRYLGHFNTVYKDAMNDFENNEARHHAKYIADEIRQGHKLYGKSGEKIMKAQFTGKYVEEFADLLETGLIEMVELSQFVILNTPYCYCIHDKSMTNNMPCQRGLDIDNFDTWRGVIPFTGRCKPASCSNAVFTEEDVALMQANQLYNSIPKEFLERVSNNLYFVNNDVLEELDLSMESIVYKYNKDQNEKGEE
tara:strand:+ start:17237 stop:19129 length:1893 start_codon:yes stop_codon:yes gene_type:complete